MTVAPADVPPAPVPAPSSAGLKAPEGAAGALPASMAALPPLVPAAVLMPPVVAAAAAAADAAATPTPMDVPDAPR